MTDEEYLSLFIKVKVSVNFKSLFSPENGKCSTPHRSQLVSIEIYLLFQGKSEVPCPQPGSPILLGGSNFFPSYCNDKGWVGDPV